MDKHPHISSFKNRKYSYSLYFLIQKATRIKILRKNLDFKKDLESYTTILYYLAREGDNQLFLEISNVTSGVSFYPCTADSSLGYSH